MLVMMMMMICACDCDYDNDNGRVNLRSTILCMMVKMMSCIFDF